MRKFKFSTQVRLVCATMAIHNFIRRNSRSDAQFEEAEKESSIDEDNCHQNQEDSSSSFTASSSARMNRIRDTIRNKIVRDL